jgi:hypothetical protein
MTDLDSARLAGESAAYEKVGHLLVSLFVAHRTKGQRNEGYMQALEDVTDGVKALLGVKPLAELESQLAGTTTEIEGAPI